MNERARITRLATEMPPENNARLAMFAPHESAARCVLRGFSRVPADIDDMMQEVWLRLLRSTHVPDNPRGYMTVTARNIAVDFIRRKKAVPLAALCDTDSPDDDVEVPDPAPSFEQQINANQQLKEIIDIVLKMPKEMQRYFIAVKIYDKHPDEIARQYRVTRRTVERLIMAAVRILANKLGERLPEFTTREAKAICEGRTVNKRYMVGSK